VLPNNVIYLKNLSSH